MVRILFAIAGDCNSASLKNRVGIFLCTQIEAYKCLNTKPLDLNVFDVTEIK
jgi:hypothetical protein